MYFIYHTALFYFEWLGKIVLQTKQGLGIQWKHYVSPLKHNGYSYLQQPLIQNEILHFAQCLWISYDSQLSGNCFLKPVMA